ncbi:UDP-N-acetylglucosamine pyrophosphorylase [Nannocystis sp. SCPEA4]|uniref:UDP-N-acetylglucosamine pyrophosphorylase n=1 Tax=Nannocystis sp. SCPEA4 TaxID=2996787 RepID=UPI00226D49DE|nr:UDP-N-acetylglucosamine pyrophosphorylase [Nannocystis sp. SCPEA4]MCY1056931.1 UDP-N-acetylglucosamine pyrophosphorylase [Nannocystis sp. SCPEA4]
MTDVAAIEARLSALAQRGVQIIDPRQTYVAPEVRVERIHAGVVLHPGTRLQGARTFLGPGAELGREGPVVAVDCVLGEKARIDGGYACGAVLLRGASAGSASHLREGTLLEEEASTAHAVGLKHTIVLSFGTLGSLINFCDVLLTGGTSREDHSEVGSGFIHFNFTPWGARGDKATASLLGDVPRGVLLRERRIFLGGAGGMVGPRQVGFGAVTGAGQVVRKDVPEDRLVVQPPRAVDQPFAADQLDGAEPRAGRQIRYIAQLHALLAWYRQVRLARVPGSREDVREVMSAAISTLTLCVAEREKRLAAFLKERGEAVPRLTAPELACPLAIAADEPYVDHVAWVRGLAAEDVARCVEWLRAVESAVIAGAKP